LKVVPDSSYPLCGMQQVRAEPNPCLISMLYFSISDHNPAASARFSNVCFWPFLLKKSDFQLA
jgi:hypothetical protein